MNKIKVNWTGKYPNLCSGKWEITFNEIKMIVPSAFINSSMGTAGNYQSWHFENWSEVFESYDDGLEYGEWIKLNIGWIKAMFESAGVISIVTSEDIYNLYSGIQSKDWRNLSCGGCI
jgi:hypothetical protein